MVGQAAVEFGRCEAKSTQGCQEGKMNEAVDESLKNRCGLTESDTHHIVYTPLCFAYLYPLVSSPPLLNLVVMDSMLTGCGTARTHTYTHTERHTTVRIVPNGFVV